jgi:hypothetical protein
LFPQTTDDVVQASLYFHVVLDYDTLASIFCLMPVFPTLDKSIIDDWKRGPSVLQDWSKLGARLFDIVQSSKEDLAPEYRYSSSDSDRVPQLVQGNCKYLNQGKNIEEGYVKVNSYNPILNNSKIFQVKPPFTFQLNLEPEVSKLSAIDALFFESSENFTNSFKQQFLFYKTTLRRFSHLMIDLVDTDLEKYVVQLLAERYCNIMVPIFDYDLYFKLMSQFLQRPIYLFIKKKIENNERPNKFLRHYPVPSPTKGALYFYMTIIFSNYETADASWTDDSVPIRHDVVLYFLYPNMCQLPRNTLKDFFRNEDTGEE